MTTSFATVVVVLGISAALSLTACLEPGVKDRCASDMDCLEGRRCADEGRCVNASPRADDGGTLCTDTCDYADDDVCDDGSTDAVTNLCARGTDCSDCAAPGLQRRCFGICPGEGIGCNDDVCMERAIRADGYRCSALSPCPSEQQCRFGYCVDDCENPIDCFRSYCVDDAQPFCAPVADAACSAQAACEVGHTCIEEICVVVDDAAGCTTDAECGFWSQCLQVRGERRCSEVPFCDRDMKCAPGAAGAVCNAGHLVDKGSICLQAHCLTSDDCAPDYTCVPSPDADTGRCSDHTRGAFCAVAADCTSGNCAGVDVDVPYGSCL